MEDNSKSSPEQVPKSLAPHCIIVKSSARSSSIKFQERATSHASISASISLKSSPISGFQSARPKTSLAESDRLSFDNKVCFEDLILEQKERYFEELQTPGSELSKVVSRQSKKIMFFWRGINSMFPYSFKKCELVELEPDGSYAMDVSVDLSNKRIEKAKDERA